MYNMRARSMASEFIAAFAFLCLVSSANPWDKYMLSPGQSRTMVPVSWKVIPAGSAPPPPSVKLPSLPLPLRLRGRGDAIMFDWGQEVGGFTTLMFGATSDASQSLSLAYSESSYYWMTGDHSNGGQGDDGNISTGSIVPHSNYTPSVNHMRGGFRYLNLALETDGWVDVQLPSVLFTAAPNMADPSDWKSHFYSSDDVLNRVWYGCGYTVQMCSIDPSQGRQWPPPSSGWNNNVSIGIGNTVLVDGAKRDRMIWPGDMGISSLVAIVTTGDLEASRNALNTLFKYQAQGGMLPYVGPPIIFGIGTSDTYHLWSLIGTYNVAVFDCDESWLQSVWAQYQLGLEAASAKVSFSSGLFNVTAPNDWQRVGQGGENCPANMLYFRVLCNAVELASQLGHHTAAAQYAKQADALRTAILARLWDDAKGAFFDNTNNQQLYPQDGNSLAVWFNLTSPSQAKRVSDYLYTNWGAFGAGSPEWNDDIGTFSGSMEVLAHMAAGEAERAHNLIRLQWGYMLSKPESTQSTFWEGYHKDGSFAFEGMYMSNAHGWAAGPAAALSFNTLGIRPLGIFGMLYAIEPQFGNLKHCRGRVSFGCKGFVDAAWNILADGLSIYIDSSTYTGSLGRLTLSLGQFLGSSRTLQDVTVNGLLVWLEGRQVCMPGDVCNAVMNNALLRVLDGSQVVEISGMRPQRLSIEVKFNLAADVISM